MQYFIILATISTEKHTLVFYSTKSMGREMYVKGTWLRYVLEEYVKDKHYA